MRFLRTRLACFKSSAVLRMRFRFRFCLTCRTPHNAACERIFNEYCAVRKNADGVFL